MSSKAIILLSILNAFLLKAARRSPTDVNLATHHYTHCRSGIFQTAHRGTRTPSASVHKRTKFQEYCGAYHYDYPLSELNISKWSYRNPVIITGLNLESGLTCVLMAVIGIFLIITGLVQKYAHRIFGTKTTTGIKDAVLLGVVQALSVFPGLIRSVLAVSTLLIRGYNSEYAIVLSLLMGIPVIRLQKSG